MFQQGRDLSTSLLKHPNLIESMLTMLKDQVFHIRIPFMVIVHKERTTTLKK